MALGTKLAVPTRIDVTALFSTETLGAKLPDNW